MSAPTNEWTRHEIPELGLAFDARSDWPLETFSLPDGVIVFQRLPGDVGAFLVRYGPGQTLNAVLANLGGGRTTEHDESATVAGLPARRVEVTLRERGGGTFRGDVSPRERSPIVVTRMVLAGLTVRETPVVAGYRVDADERATYEPDLERMLSTLAMVNAV
jgi:hypothetical protein